MARAAALSAALLAAVLALLALRAGSAGIDARIAQDTLVRLDAARPLPPSALARARDAAEAARAAAPRAGAPDEWLARLALHAAATSTDPAARRPLRAAARAHALAAWQARPAWPYAAALVAAVEAADQRFGERFAAAVEAAWRLGRHERRVRETLARLWLQPAARAGAPVLAQAFDAELAAAPEAWIDAADRAGAGPEACARPQAPARAAARCADLGWDPDRAETATAPRG